MERGGLGRGLQSLIQMKYLVCASKMREDFFVSRMIQHEKFTLSFEGLRKSR